MGRATRRLIYLLAAATLAIGAAGCGDDDAASGTLSATVYGEEFIEEGIPAEEMDDDWAVDFQRFIVTVEEVKIAGQTIEDAGPIDISDASDGDGHRLGQVHVEAGTHASPSFVISSVEVSGSATKDQVTKSFDWTFDGTTHYSGCATTVEVADGGAASFEFTIHGDHLFFDSLVADEPAVVFAALADADANEDGDITQAELAAADIGAYDPGNAAIDDLWSWLVAQSQLIGHVDGEGHCDSHAH